MEFENLLTLIDKVASTDLSDFAFDNGEVKIHMKKKKKEVILTASEGISTPSVIMAQTEKSSADVQEESIPSGNVIKAPLVGTFYYSSSPENPPFVKVGDKVKKGQILGIIEAMKLMNEIESEYDGIIEAILIENEHMVEYGQPLFVIK